MIPNSSDVAEIQSNIDGQTGQFTVDENSLTKIMSVLTNLYADPEGAVAREYLTNALDSQIEAQQKDPNYVWRPVEVTTPSSFSKQYTIRDFGIGMNVEDIVETYSKYGKSTKEASNLVTGMLGLGSKCALTYTNQFTVTGYKNGVMTQALISKNEEGIPEFHIVDTCATNEPNGVMVAVPVRDRNSFAQKTAALLRWWPKGQVLVDGREPEKHGFEHIRDAKVDCVRLVNGDKKVIKDDAQIHLLEGGRFNAQQSYVIMGNVPYTVDMEHVPNVLRDAGMGFAAFVPMGAVDFPPNRETLTYTGRTVRVLNEIGKGLYEHILAKHVKAIGDAGTFLDAYNVRQSIPYPFKNDAVITNIKYRGYEFPGSRFQFDHKTVIWDYNDSAKVADRQYVDVDWTIRNTIVVTGFDISTKPTSYFKKKIRHYISQKNLSADKAVLLDTDMANVWFSHLPRVTADTIKAIKLPRNPSANTGPRVATPFEYFWYDGAIQTDSQVKIVTQPGTVLTYISPADLRETWSKQGTNERALIKALGKGTTMVVLGKNRFEKFLREYPQATTVEKYAQNLMKTLEQAASTTDGTLSECGEYLVKWLAKTNENEIVDPDIKALIAAAKKGGSGNYEKARELMLYMRRASVFLPEPKKPKATFDPKKRYPLLDNIGWQDEGNGLARKHYVCYMNAAYKDLVQP